MKKEIECIVRGRVQMVMFRDFTRRKASKLGVKGLVENMPDGTVHIVAQAENETLEKFLGYIRKGSVLSRVDNVEVAWRDPEVDYKGFEIHY